jgi:hypothetical protein
MAAGSRFAGIAIKPDNFLNTETTHVSSDQTLVIATSAYWIRIF